MSKNKLVLKRHKVAVKVFGALYLPFVKRKYNIDITKFDSKGEQYLIMMNHQTQGDQFFVNMAFPGQQIYFIASEDILSNGFVSKLLKYFLAPIPIKNNATDVKAVKQSMRITKEGGLICLAPEGNRTFSGETVNINPAISKLAKALRLPIAIFTIHGGYGKHPRWSDVVREGKMSAGVSRVIPYEEYKDLSDDDLYNLIKEELYVDESSDRAVFHSKNNAEYIERFMYYCPNCKLTTLRSCKDLVKCEKCGLTIKYEDDKTLTEDGKPFKYLTLKDWYNAQSEYILNTDLENMFNDKMVFSDYASMRKCIPGIKKTEIDKNSVLKLYVDRIEVDTKVKKFVFSFDDISAVSVLGKNKLNIYHLDDVYQFKGDKRFNPVKYMNFYFKYQNVRKDDLNDKFLGL